MLLKHKNNIGNESREVWLPLKYNMRYFRVHGNPMKAKSSQNGQNRRSLPFSKGITQEFGGF